MTKDLRDRWVAALRSGMYQQGKGYLHRGDRFCCLGVLCEVVGVTSTKTLDAIYRYEFGINGGSASSSLKGELGAMVADQSALIDMNDERNHSFNKIADWIEKHVPVEP